MKVMNVSNVKNDVKGHLLRPGDDNDGADSVKLAPWEELVVDAVGNTIDFWRFKRNHGRVWALLYLRGRALSAGEIERAMGLSKGAVSMVTRELETWGVVKRARVPSDATWRFVAETDLMKMIRRVIEDREGQFVSRVRQDLEQAEKLARAAGNVSPDVLARLSRMRTLAAFIDKALRAFVLTAKLDVGGVVNVLQETTRRRT